MGGVGDGAITVNTNINNSGFRRDGQELLGRARQVAGAMSKAFGGAAKGINKEMAAATKGLNDTTIAINNTLARMKEIEMTGGGGAEVTSKAFESAKLKVEQTGLAIRDVKLKMAELARQNRDAKLVDAEQAVADVKKVEAEIDRLIDKQIRMQDKQRGLTAQRHNLPADAPILERLTQTDLSQNREYQALGAQIADVEKKLAAAAQRAETAKTALKNAANEPTPEYQKLAAQLDNLKLKQSQNAAAVRSAHQAALASTGTQSAEYKKLAGQLDTLKTKQQQYAAHYEQAAQSMGGHARNTDRAARATDRLGQSMRSAQQKAGGLLGSMMKLGTMLKLMVIRRALSAMINAVRQGFQDLAQVNTPFQQAMSSMQSGFLQVRNAAASAFAPAIQALVPIINTLTSALASALNILAAFTARLFGGSATYYKAAKAATSYGGAVGGAGKAAKEAEEEMKSQMSTLDELNVLNDDAAKSTPSGGGGGGGGGAPADMWEEVEVPSWIDDFIDKLQSKLAAFVDYIKSNFAPSIAAIGAAWEQIKGSIAIAVDILKTALINFWETALLPLLGALESFFVNVVNGFVTMAAPIAASFISWGIEQFALNVAFFLEMIGNVINDFLIPAIEFLEGVALDVFTAISAAWEMYGATIITKMTEFMEGIREIWRQIYDVIIKPILEGFMELVTMLWNEHLYPLWQNLTMFIGELTVFLLDLWNNVLQPLVMFLISFWGPQVKSVFKTVGDFIGTVVGAISDRINAIITVLRGLLTFLTGVFTGDWEKAWEGIKTIAGGVWDGITGVFKNAINAIISVVNGMLRGVANGLNAIIGAINSVSITIPDWVPGLGGKSFGPSIPEFSAPQIPMLAQGAVIPANREFMAVLGDQTNGRNIEAPEGLIRQIMREEAADIIKNALGNGEQVIEIYLDSDVLYRGMVRAGKDKGYSVGGGFALEY